MTILIMLVLCLVGLLADMTLREATLRPQIASQLVVLGSFLYASTGFGWYTVFKSTRFVSVGVIYPMFTLLLFVIVGVLLYGERLTGRDILGVVTAVAAMVLLRRFS